MAHTQLPSVDPCSPPPFPVMRAVTLLSPLGRLILLQESVLEEPDAPPPPRLYLALPTPPFDNPPVLRAAP